MESTSLLARDPADDAGVQIDADRPRQPQRFVVSEHGRAERIPGQHEECRQRIEIVVGLDVGQFPEAPALRTQRGQPDVLGDQRAVQPFPIIRQQCADPLARRGRAVVVDVLGRPETVDARGAVAPDRLRLSPVLRYETRRRPRTGALRTRGAARTPRPAMHRSACRFVSRPSLPPPAPLGRRSRPTGQVVLLEPFRILCGNKLP